MAHSQQGRQTYQTADVVKATGLDASALQRYMQRGYFPLQPCDIPSTGSGDNRGYSFRRVLQIALAAESIHIGISPSRSAKAAFEVSDKGNPGRQVGEVFPLGMTFLVGLCDGQNKVINIPPDLTIADVLSNDTAAFIINVNNVASKVTKELDNK